MRGAPEDYARSAKQSMRALREAEQKTALVVANPRGELREPQPVRVVPARESPDQPVDLDEIAQDLEDPSGAPHGSSIWEWDPGHVSRAPVELKSFSAA